MGDLRSRRHQQTKQEIVSAALELFAHHGFDNVTMEQIAEAAGVSRSTLYRRFPSRSDVLLDVITRWLDVWDECRAARSDLIGIELLEACCRAVAHHIDAAAAEVRLVYEANDSAELAAARARFLQAWISRVVAVLSTGPAAADLDPEEIDIVAAAYMGGINQLMDRWAARGERSVAASTELLLARLRPIWPAQATSTEAGPSPV